MSDSAIVQDIVSGGLRLAALSMRMILALFMARYLPFTDIGVFSLLIGLTGLLPGAAGLGVGFFVNRDIVVMVSSRAVLLARDRLIVTAVCGIICSLGVAQAGLPVSPWISGLLIVLEMIAFDLHFLLIARHRAGIANVLMFVRSASWIPVFMILAYAFPQLRDVDALAKIWLGGVLLSLLVTIGLFRHILSSRAIWTTAFDPRPFRAITRRALPVWISDFALAAGQYADRFVISSFLGVAAAGVYYFYLSIANGAFIAIQSATTQPYMPRLRTLYAERCHARFIEGVGACLKKLIALSLISFALAQIGTLVIVKLLGRPELSAQWHIMPILLIGMFGKAIGDYLGTLDYIMEHDRRFIAVNIASFAAVIASVALMTQVLGLTGAALGVAGTLIAVAAGRWKLWRDSRSRLRGPIPA